MHTKRYLKNLIPENLSEVYIKLHIKNYIFMKLHFEIYVSYIFICNCINVHKYDHIYTLCK